MSTDVVSESETETVFDGELSTLPKLEAVIESGLTVFVTVGNALMEIRNGRLYRETHSTFEQYCLDRWGISRSHAYKLMGAAEVVNAFPVDVTVPKVLTQALALVDISEETRVAVWEAAQKASSGKPTEKTVKIAKTLVQRMNDVENDPTLSIEAKKIKLKCLNDAAWKTKLPPKRSTERWVETTRSLSKIINDKSTDELKLLEADLNDNIAESEKIITLIQKRYNLTGV